MTLSRRLRRIWRFYFPLFGLKSLRRVEVIGLDNNRLIAAEAQRVLGRVEFSLGSGSSVEIGARSEVSGIILIRGDNNIVQIGPDCVFRGRITIKGANLRVTIGENTTCAGVSILAQENSDVLIGSNCMFSREIEIRTSDAHSVIDRKTLHRLNKPGTVTIGNHVWLGLRAIVSKGVSIADDTIVGAGSFVNKSFDETGVVLAGSPAKVVRRGITWRRERKSRFRRADLDTW